VCSSLIWKTSWSRSSLCLESGRCPQRWNYCPISCITAFTGGIATNGLGGCGRLETAPPGVREVPKELDRKMMMLDERRGGGDYADHTFK
jgi:hypothetical protein